MLLDPGSFTEFDELARHRAHDFGMEPTRPYGDGVVTGYGTVDGRPVCVFSQDFTVFGGSLGEVYGEKIVKVMDHALKTGCPVIGINDGGGARIQEGVVALGLFAEIFYRNVIASGVIPQISLIMGPCAGGAVYSPAITDFTLMVDGTSHMFITGPGRHQDGDRRGGHASRTSAARTRTTPSPASPTTRPRTSTTAWTSPASCCPTCRPTTWTSRRRWPATGPGDTSELDGPTPSSTRSSPTRRTSRTTCTRSSSTCSTTASSCEVHAAVRAEHRASASAGSRARPVGVVANQPMHFAGCLDIDASEKAARFVRTCDAFNIPVLTFVDVPGFLPGTEPGVGRDHPPRRQAHLRLRRGHRPEGHGDHPQGVRRRLRRDGLQAPGRRTSTWPGRPRRSRSWARRAR